MAAVTNAKTAIARDLTGVNLTDATFQTLVAGGSNGAKFTYAETDIVILKNDTGGDAVFTFTVGSTPGSFATFGVTTTSPTKTVADGKTLIVRLSDLFKNSSGEVVITCDVAGKLLVLNPT